VIATEVGGIPELVRNGENGILVPPADSLALAEAIDRLADDPETAFRMGQKGRQRVEREFTLERKIVETEQLCASLLHATMPVSRAAND
jgi:glycosyltransferase involved in cell wall biosynthesis